MTIKCPHCDSEEFFYVQRVDEYHKIDSIEENGEVEFASLEDTRVVSGL